MMRLFLNGVAASAGAGLTYIRNVVPQLSVRAETQATIALTPSFRSEFGNPPNVSFVEVESQGVGHRFWREQALLPRMIQRAQADVLISTGNFAVRKSPVPQILLSGNSLYTSADFYRDLRARREFGLWLETRLKGILAKRSIHWADCTVAPSEAFAAELRRWAGGKVVSIYHGFDNKAFFDSGTALPIGIQESLDSADGALRLLFVSHYAYYRNFETLLRAMPALRDRLKPRKVKLFLTSRLVPGANPGSYKTGYASALIRQLKISDNVIELGAVPYFSLHRLYRACDIYTTAAYAETFAHPLVEAMSSGIPVVAADLPVHREICGNAALYFKRFSPDEFVDRIIEIVSSPNLGVQLAANGVERSHDFSWRRHVDQLMSLAGDLLHAQSGRARAIIELG